MINSEKSTYISKIIDMENNPKSISYQAKFDYLTNTLNRRSLVTMLNELFVQSKTDHSLHACLFFDLDRFKDINDRYGHDTGDKLLVAIVDRIKPLLAENDIFSRMSGDEFAIILRDIDKTSSDGMKRVNEISAKISSVLSKPFRLNEYEIITSVSIGVRLFPDDAKTASDVMVHADAAMYRAKKKKRGSVFFYDKQMAKEHEASLLLKKELDIAYKNNEYCFFFQPKVDVQTNKIKGVEILVRWKHKERGLLFPSDFFKEAFKIGMISKITDLSIHEACKFLVSTKNFYRGTVAINVSSREITDTFFVSRLVTIIQEYQVDPSRIELEILENELIQNFDLAIILIKKLQELGIAVSMDDFGTGYSSITYLHKLPVNILKIDKSFIENVKVDQESDKDWVLLQTIANMAKAFNIKIIAEGVETKEQLAMVKKLGIDEYQGFLFSKAVDKDTLLGFVKR